jgi:hypothetical protein
MGKIVEKLREKFGKLLVQTTSQSSPVPMVHKAERAAAIDILPDDVLLQIFDFCQVEYRPPWPPCHFILEWRIEWRRLVQVCRRWRQLIFSSPGRLDLYLICTYGTPVRKNLDIWPAFPIAIDYVNHLFMPNRYFWPDDEDNVNTALKHPDRVRCLKVPVTSLLLENMTQPFPILTHLWLSSKNPTVSGEHIYCWAAIASLTKVFHIVGGSPPTVHSNSATILSLSSVDRYLSTTSFLSCGLIICNTMGRLLSSIVPCFQLKRGSYVDSQGYPRRTSSLPMSMIRNLISCVFPAMVMARER